MINYVFISRKKLKKEEKEKNMYPFQWILINFGIPGFIGMILGIWLFSNNVRENGNILGQTPWHPFAGAIGGGVVFGFAIWFIFGLCLGLSN